PEVVLPDSRDQALIAIERFLNLDYVVGHQLCRRINTRQAAPDDDRGQVDLEIRQAVLLVSARSLQTHQKVGRLPHATQNIVLHRNQRGLTSTCRNGDVIEPVVPSIVDRQGSSKSNTVEQAELLTAHQYQVVHVQEILVPAYCDAVFGNTTEPQNGSLI